MWKCSVWGISLEGVSDLRTRITITLALNSHFTDKTTPVVMSIEIRFARR